MLLKKVGDPDRYGVAALDERRQMIVQIEEKPKKPKSDYAVIGIYMYDSKVFDFIRKIKPSSRGEMEVSSLNNKYVEIGELEHGIVDGDWTDAGTYESLIYANEMLLKNDNSLVK